MEGDVDVPFGLVLGCGYTSLLAGPVLEIREEVLKVSRLAGRRQFPVPPADLGPLSP